ncbi:3-dehydroquinate synthase [Mesonia sp. K7]|uniref:3-dehydroquinate synthase n=1 Tax=Mesonia sp. K7 TaxID=2218606 RepID=UPI000DAA2308|nr:3-dehydroquinate synthase [Mesonia sp. K7]PZD79291.1 3-dehydroquinate synthase [Mesonia sp. K7]
MQMLIGNHTKLFYGDHAYAELNMWLTKNTFANIFILVDSNTQAYCLPHFLPQLATSLPIEVIEIEAGEENKTIETCTGIWETLSELGAKRNSLLMNLGGGMTTDIGGFIASTYQRGISFINIPTSLLGMVDASAGGKTGVNLNTLKNQVGSFKMPEIVLLDINYLETLPQRELKSGLAEMYKHGLITSKNYWKELSDLSQLSLADLENLILTSINIKDEVVTKDIYENGLRKILNFGHTLGHAIESYSHQDNQFKNLTHGEAIAIGMVLESHLSYSELDLPHKKVEEIKKVLLQTFEKVHFTEKDIAEIIQLLQYDKKNNSSAVNFVLLEDIGQAKIDIHVSEKQIIEAFRFYLA